LDPPNVTYCIYISKTLVMERMEEVKNVEDIDSGLCREAR